MVEAAIEKFKEGGIGKDSNASPIAPLDFISDNCSDQDTRRSAG
jgi:hypothetical protein